MRDMRGVRGVMLPHHVLPQNDRFSKRDTKEAATARSARRRAAPSSSVSRVHSGCTAPAGGGAPRSRQACSTHGTTEEQKGGGAGKRATWYLFARCCTSNGRSRSSAPVLESIRCAASGRRGGASGFPARRCRRRRARRRRGGRRRRRRRARRERALGDVVPPRLVLRDVARLAAVLGVGARRVLRPPRLLGGRRPRRRRRGGLALLLAARRRRGGAASDVPARRGRHAVRELVAREDLVQKPGSLDVRVARQPAFRANSGERARTREGPPYEPPEVVKHPAPLVDRASACPSTRTANYSSQNKSGLENP